MMRIIETISGSRYFISEERNMMSGGKLPRPMVIAALNPILIDGISGISATLADPVIGMVRINTSPVVKISGLLS